MISLSHLSRQLEEVWRAVTGLDDTVTTVEAGYEDHAEAVEVTVGGAAPLVLDLGCWQPVRQLNSQSRYLPR